MKFCSLFLHFLLLIAFICPIYSFETSSHQLSNQTSESEEFHKTITNRLQQINKPAVKTIHSPDGDIIDCVLSHKQPAFDHPLLKGQKPLDPPKRPRGHNQVDFLSDNFQLWSLSGESCPEGTIPIIRTKKEDMLRADSISRFGRKLNQVRRDATEYVHEHSYGYVTGDRYFGAKANINVWVPHVENQDFSLAQIWVLGGDFVDTVEAGWQVYPAVYGDNSPRFFVYWTADGYNETGCYDLNCPGFVQTNNQVAIGGAISPTSVYNGQQYDITYLIYKDQKSGNWWLEYGSNVIGYWPSSLFTILNDSATKVEFGGEVFTTSTGPHTSTQMGSGHFSEEGYQKASYFKNLQVVDSNNELIPLSNLKFIAERPDCYNIQGGFSNEMGNYFYFGGPGRNEKCP